MILSGLTKNVLQFFLDNLPEPMFAVDTDLRYVAFNQAHADVMRSLYGASVQRGLSLLDAMTAPADCGAIVPSLNRALAGEPVVARFTSGRDAEVRRSFEVSYVPLRDATGTVHGVGVVARDLTDAQRALEAERGLRQSEERLRLMYEQAPVAYQSLDADGRFLEVNPRWLELLGYSRDEVIGRWFGDFLMGAGPELFRERFPVFKERGATSGAEFVLRHKDGHGLPIAFDGRIGRDVGGAFRQTHCVLHDLSEERALDARKAEMDVRFRQQQKLESIGTLASGVAHEINNPLNVILNYCELIRDEATGPGPIRGFADHVTHEAERVATIVRNLLRFARQDVGAQSPAQVEDLVEGTLSLARSSLRKDNIALEVSLPPDLPTVRCRTQQIQQVLMNLLTNARDAVNERFPGRDPDKRVVVSAALFERDGAVWVRLTVQDWGGGIPPAVATRVFDPFFTTKARDKGTGLGLSISYGLAREHGGELWFESAPGEPTRFHLELATSGAGPTSSAVGCDYEVS